jgi:chorismate mutase
MNTLFQNIPTTEGVRKVGPGEGEKFDVGGAHLTFVWITIAATGTKKPVFESLGSSILNWTPKLLRQNQIRSSSMKNFMRATRLVLAVMTLFAANTNAGTQEELAAYRKQIDSLDQRIVELIQQRARVVENVGNIKREAHLAVTVPGREQQVIERAKELARGGPLPAEAAGRIYQKLVEEMRNWEAKLHPVLPQSSSEPGRQSAANKIF